MKRTPRTLIGMTALAVSLSALTACGESEAGSGDAAAEGDEEMVVEYGGQTIVPDLVFRAKEWGEPHDVEIVQTRFPSGSEAFEALLSGEVNVSNGGSGRLITIASQRPDAVSIIAKWQFGGNRYSILTAPGSALSSPADLKGKTVAVDTGSGAFTLLQVWLDQNGLSPDDIKIIQTKVGDIGSALQSGSADVGVAWEPTASLLVEKDLAVRFDTLESAGQSPNFLIADKEWANDNQEAVVAFLKAAIDVGELIIEDPDTAGQMAADVNSAEGVKAPATALAESLRHIEMAPEIDDASLEELSTLAEELVEQQKIPAVPEFEPMVDDSFLKEAMNG